MNATSGGDVWLLLADGRRARILTKLAHDELRDLERLASAQGVGGSRSRQSNKTLSDTPLEELFAFEISEDELYDIQDSPARAFDRVGPGRHAMDGGRDLHEQEEVKFLERVANHVAEAEKQGAFAHLVIAAPPRALGILRTALPAEVKAKVKAETAKDLLGEPDARLRAHLDEAMRG